MYLCLMYVCPDVSNSGGGDVPTSDVSKSAPSRDSIYRGARLIVPRFWNSKFERIRGIWTIEPLRGLLIEHHSKEG